ncbi:CRISPR-associated helicase Cas3' [Longispora sp. NPDC051575]|uniref:CRISPR-associated helicase Cas3' n=1 Tax=Longispora sp. NPDC051575 TaxID=3154943 RepID=UPI0034323A9D
MCLTLPFWEVSSRLMLIGRMVDGGVAWGAWSDEWMVGGQSGVDARVWGKSRGLGFRYPLICHLLDTAEMAGALWESFLSPAQRESIASALDRSEQDARRWVMFIAGLHDVGKVVPSFQKMEPEAFGCLVGSGWQDPSALPGGAADIRHDRAGHLLLPDLLLLRGYRPGRTPASSVPHQIGQLLGGHHGTFNRSLPADQWDDPARFEPGLGAAGWSEERVRLVEAVHHTTGSPEPLVRLLGSTVATQVLGLVIVADWLASQEHLITASRPAPDWVADADGLRVHLGAARRSAPAAVRRAGLGSPARWSPGGFRDMFPEIATPNDLQASLDHDLERLVRGPGLLLVTAPTGDGKTEAALFGAQVLGRAAGTSGIFVALPTMATANQIHRRVAEFASRQLTDDAALILLHSMSWMNDEPSTATVDNADESGAILSEGSTSVAATSWLRGARRGLLAPLGVGTIDQALTGVLPTRWNVLRLMGLSGKTVIIDEAHAYDPWMHALIVRLLQWLGAFKVPVVLLSATLTGPTAASLVQAYRDGAGHAAPVSVEARYPGWVFVDAVSGEVSEPREVATNRPRSLDVRVVAVRHSHDPDEVGGRAAAIRAELEAVVDGRGTAAVICTTVAEAQQTYRMLASWFEKLPDPPQLALLHARFPAYRREELITQAEGSYGKDGRRPGRGVLVATQIIEQSMDLDFDLIVTDLAPLAMILQRAGRCWRHDRDPALRANTGPQVRVLAPIGESGALSVPRSWGEVYSPSLLLRTFELLSRREGAPIEVPADVQGLVDEVYARDFASADPDKLFGLDLDREVDEQTKKALAELVAIPKPTARPNLYRISNPEAGLSEDMVATRLGADADRVVCCYHDERGDLWLDELCRYIRLPTPRRDNRFTRDQERLIMRHTVPLRAGLMAKATPAQTVVPATWEENSHLKYLRMLRFPGGAGVIHEVAVGDRTWILSREAGLTVQ